MPFALIAAASSRPLFTLDAADAAREPPTEFRIWELGKVRTKKGTFRLTAKDAKAVLADWQDWGNRLTFDYGHDATLGRRGEDGKSAGSFLLELREDGLWAVDVRWTAQASAQLAAGEWLYFSPTFFSDPKTGAITSLINIALTNVPATKDMTPLVAAAQETPMDPKEQAEQKLAAARQALSLACAGFAALEADPDEAGDAESEEMKKAKAAKRGEAMKKLAKAKLEYESALRECAAFGEEPADKDKDAPGDDEPPPPKSKPDPKATSQTRQWTAKGMARIVALAGELTGGKTEAEVLGKLAALGATAEGGADAQNERIAQLEKTVFLSRAEVMLKAASDAGKLTPKQRAYALRIESIEELTAYLDTLPVVAKTPSTKVSPDVANLTHLAVDTLEQWEIEMCDRMGTTREAYVAQKRGNAERRSASAAPKPVALTTKTA